MFRIQRLSNGIRTSRGHVQHNRDEIRILFTLLAERYERRSVILTTNPVFSEWALSQNPMATMATIDRIVHHSVILDLPTAESYRAKKQRRSTTTSRQDKQPNRKKELSLPANVINVRQAFPSVGATPTRRAP